MLGEGVRRQRNIENPHDDGLARDTLIKIMTVTINEVI